MKIKKNKSKILVYIVFFAVCLLSGKLFFSFYSPFFVGSSSMEPEFPVYTLIILDKTPYTELKAGDTVVFRSDALGGGLAFHRIVKFEEGGFFTKGDNNSFEDNQLITEDAYIGKCALAITFFARYLAALQKPFGLLLYLLLPAAALIALCASVKYLKKSKCKQ